jgi:hypothetical protein
MSSVTSAKGVSSTVGSAQRVNKRTSDDNGGAFVDMIDTSNNIFVKDELSDHSGQKQQEYQNEKEENNQVVSDTSYVNNALEALIASGVYEEEQASYDTQKKVNVYGNNQKIK